MRENDRTPLLRIGELSRRVGVTTDRLRAWEQRYGLLEPARTAGGFRLYSQADEQRIRQMLDHLADGLSAAEAAHTVLAAPGDGRSSVAALKAQLSDALARFDDRTADGVLSALFASHGHERTLRDVIYPSLRELGEAWACGEIDVAQEHFASNLIQRRLTALLPDAEHSREGARALLACPSGEHHVLGLIGLGVALRRRGWRVTYLGADTPVPTIARTARVVRPAVIVVAVTMAHCLPAHAEELGRLGEEHPLLLAGAGADAGAAKRVGAGYIDADPAGAAAFIADSAAPPRDGRPAPV